MFASLFLFAGAVMCHLVGDTHYAFTVLTDCDSFSCKFLVISTAHSLSTFYGMRVVCTLMAQEKALCIRLNCEQHLSCTSKV